MASETPPSAVNNSNLVDLLSTLNPAVTTMGSSSAVRSETMNVDSSDFVPANRLLLQRQAIHNHKQCMSKTNLPFEDDSYFLFIDLVESLREQQQQLQNMEVDDQQAFEVSFTKHR